MNQGLEVRRVLSDGYDDVDEIIETEMLKLVDYGGEADR